MDRIRFKKSGDIANHSPKRSFLIYVKLKSFIQIQKVK